MFIPVENRLGIQPIDQSSSVQNHDLGTLLRARDPIYGEGEFIYLLGVIGTAIGTLIIWEGQSTGVPTYQTALAPGTPFLGQPLAVSMSVNAAAQYGWYQLGGQAVAQTNGTVAASSPVFLAGNGQLTTIVLSGQQILDAISITASGVPSSGLAVVEIDRPFAQGETGSSVPVRAQRSIVTSGDLPLVLSDSILNINAASDLSPVVLVASSRSGAPFTFKNLVGSHSQTLTRTSPDTFDGQTTLVLAAGSSVTLVPYNDGINAGYAVE